MKKFLSQVLLMALTTVLFAAPGEANARSVWTGVERIVAIGDVHGDYDQLIKLLGQAGLVDGRLQWTGGETHLVQIGDVPDRGPDTKRIMELLMDLERQARRAGGYVHPLIGNHEAMNVIGDLRYVHPGEYTAFVDKNSKRERDAYYRRTVAVLKARADPDKPPIFDAEYRRAWEARFPLGYVEHRLAWMPDGSLGKWVLKHNTIIRINDTLFGHAGLSPALAESDLKTINEAVREELGQPRNREQVFITSEDGPLWYRGLATAPEVVLRDHVAAALAAHEARRMVVGHTPQPGVIVPRFGGQVILADVGLSKAYGGGLACLVIEGDDIYALHRGHRLELPRSSAPEDIADYLRRAAALEPDPTRIEALIGQILTPPQPQPLAPATEAAAPAP